MVSGIYADTSRWNADNISLVSLARTQLGSTELKKMAKQNVGSRAG
jgi:hypothetical protein